MMIINKLCIVALTVSLLKSTGVKSTPRVTNHTSIFNSLNLQRKNYTRHAFFRSLDADAAGSSGSRRVFGGVAAELQAFPAACALLDRRRAVRCSGAVLRARWALTAAHCVTPQLAYVHYNTRRAAAADGNVTLVHSMYRHPKYKVEQRDEGHGPDVTTLQHDVGLVRTTDAMQLASSPAAILEDLRPLDPQYLYNQEVQVFGFGRTERAARGEELFAVRLRLVRCERRSWLHCVCGVADQPRGVCAGDSGGPVLYQGTPIGVTSMGPVACGGGAAGAAGATSVFTALHRYADVIAATVRGTDAAPRMRLIARATLARPCAALRALCAIILCLLYCNFTSM